MASKDLTFPHTCVTCNKATQRMSVQVLQMISSGSHTYLSSGEQIINTVRSSSLETVHMHNMQVWRTAKLAVRLGSVCSWNPCTGEEKPDGSVVSNVKRRWDERLWNRISIPKRGKIFSVFQNVLRAQQASLQWELEYVATVSSQPVWNCLLITNWWSLRICGTIPPSPYISLTYLLTYSMEQCPSWEANWFCS